jgi:hypothetical protein
MVGKQELREQPHAVAVLVGCCRECPVVIVSHRNS